MQTSCIYPYDYRITIHAQLRTLLSCTCDIIHACVCYLYVNSYNHAGYNTSMCRVYSMVTYTVRLLRAQDVHCDFVGMCITYLRVYSTKVQYYGVHKVCNAFGMCTPGRNYTHIGFYLTSICCRSFTMQYTTCRITSKRLVGQRSTYAASLVMVTT